MRRSSARPVPQEVSVEDVRETVQFDGGILDGHDGSECAQQAVQWAAGLDGRAGLDLHVLRAWSLTSEPRPATQEPGYVPHWLDFEQYVLEKLPRHDYQAQLIPA